MPRAYKELSGLLKVEWAARELYTYTAQVTKNRAKFPEEYDKTSGELLTMTALQIFHAVSDANEIRVNSSADLAERRSLQDYAIRQCKFMARTITANVILCGISRKRERKWVGDITALRELIVAWRDSDRKRYKF